MICDAFSEKNIKSSKAKIKFLNDKIKFDPNLHNSNKKKIKIINNAFSFIQISLCGVIIKIRSSCGVFCTVWVLRIWWPFLTCDECSMECWRWNRFEDWQIYLSSNKLKESFKFINNNWLIKLYEDFFYL